MTPLHHPLPVLPATAETPLPTGPNRPTFVVFNFGCKANAWDGQAMREQLLAAGAREVDPAHSTPEIVVINSCTVTDTADREALATLKRIRATYPHARLVATGCMADIRPDAMLQTGGGPRHAVLLPTQAKPRILQALGLTPRITPAVQSTALDLATTGIPARAATAGNIATAATIDHFAHHTRAFVKIEDGCDLCCSFCIIPQARGMPRSRPPEEIGREVLQLAAAGYREVVLTGIHLGAYGKDFSPAAHFAGANSAKRGPNRVADLLEHLIALPTRVRFRISSLEVTELDDRILALMAARPDRLCPHLHLPLQAGDDAILKAMRRWYTTAEFTAAVNRYRAAVPAGALSTDVIVGFPGEDRAAFDRTLHFIEQIGFSRVHAFPYSPRQKTIASRLPGHLPWRERKTRAAEIRALSVQLSHAYHAAFCGREATAILEPNPRRRRRSAAGHSAFAGYTEHYIPIRADGPADLLRRRVKVRLGSPAAGTQADHLAAALHADILAVLD